MNASLVAPVPGEDRFVRFLWISAIVHVAVFVGFVIFAKFPRSRDHEDVLSFQLVGEPARGPAGAPASPPPAPEAPVEPEVAPEPVQLPDEVPFPVAKPVATPAPTPVPTPRPVPAPTTPQPNTGSASKQSTLPAGPLAGSPTGDTLSIGGQGGEPTAMNLWLTRVKYLVERNWKAPSGLVGVTATPEVVFDVARDGRPTRPRLRVKSGSTMLDGMALRAVSSVQEFPPVPSSWKSEYVTVRYVLEYAH